MKLVHSSPPDGALFNHGVHRAFRHAGAGIPAHLGLDVGLVLPLVDPSTPGTHPRAFEPLTPIRGWAMMEGAEAYSLSTSAMTNP